jgi:hypothetical protein
VALAATAAILGVFARPRTIYMYVLVIGWVVLSSAAGGLTAGFMHPGAVAKRSSTWPVALWCMIVGVYIGVAAFFLLYAIAWVLALIALAFLPWNIGGY